MEAEDSAQRDQNKDSQDTYCEFLSPTKNQSCVEGKINSCSDSLFSQDYDIDFQNRSKEDAKMSTDSDDVKIITPKPTLIILGSDTDSIEKGQPVIIVSDVSEEKETNGESTPLSKNNSAVMEKIDTAPLTMPFRFSDSLSKTMTHKHDSRLLSNIFKCDITPVKVPLRSSPRNVSKRRNSFTCDIEIKRPARRLKRCSSVDAETEPTDTTCNSSSENWLLKSIRDRNRQKSPSASEGLSIAAIPEESATEISPLEDSQNQTNDSQNLILEFCPTQSSDFNEKPLYRSNDQTSGKEDDQGSTTITISNPDSDISKNTSKSDSLIHAIASGDFPTDQDSTNSVEIPSPLNNNIPNIPLKNKQYISGGYSSSTPENAPFTQAMRLKMKNIQISDNESDGTPPFNEFKSKKFPVILKSDSGGLRSNSSSISPLSNGHSDGSHLTNISSSNMPLFDVQVHCDDNNEFLSLLIVKTDNEIGTDISKEYQKITKRINTDHYAADISKPNSPSSVTSGGLLQLPLNPRSSFMSSSSSTSSSTRTQDGTFIIPPRPGRNISQQNCMTVKGLQALKMKVNEVISQLIDVYGGDDTAQSLSHIGDRNSANNSFECDKKHTPLGKLSTENVNGVHPATPKSSKKKIQTKNKRTLPNRPKREILPSTAEETHIDGEMHSPEMIGTDPSKCPRPSTPLSSPKYLDPMNENNNMTKSTCKVMEKKDINSPSILKNENCTAIKTDYISYEEGTVVLAKWVDKRYYSGKIKQVLEVNKYLIEFDDGHFKAIFDDFIIFGNFRELPIVEQSVFAIVDKQQNYEPSLVLAMIENDDGSISYKCTTDRDVTVSVKASDIYVTEDQAKSIKESLANKSAYSTPNTPRRRANRELDLDNIIHGPRSARFRDKCNSKKDFYSSPSSPKASTSGLSQKRRSRKDTPAPFPKQRQESESSEGGESSTRAPSTALEEVSGVQPEIQKTPRKIDGVKAGVLLVKGVSKQNAGRRSSKVTKFDSDSDTNKQLGPIPPDGSMLFKDLHFLLTCTDPPQPRSSYSNEHKDHSPTHWSDNSVSTSTDKEDIIFTTTPFNKERLKEQIEAGGGLVYSHFEDIPKNKYGICKLIAPRPCFTAKYIQCLGADIRALSHFWVVRSCLSNKLADMNEDALPAGWSIEKNRFINWKVSHYDRGTATPFKDYLILLCSDNENFIKFWRRVCTLAGGETRTINEDDLNLNGGLVIVTEWDCPHEVQNKAIQDNIPLVSTIWIVQCLIEGKICDHNASVRYNFNFSDTD